MIQEIIAKITKQEITASIVKKQIIARLTGNLIMAKPFGNDGQIQFNDNGAFGGFGFYDKETEELTLPVLKLTEPITEDSQAITLGYFNSTPSGGISALDITNWNDAFGWGDHAGLYDALGEANSVLASHNLAFNHSLIASAIQSIEKGANSGVATLDAGGKIPAGQLPSTVMEFKGTWNATTNTPNLADGTGDAGDIYLCSVAGTQNLGSGNISFAEGDWVVYNGTVWQKSINSNAVVSVNGQQGVVVLNADNISDTSTTNKFVTTAEKGIWNGKQDALGFTPENIASKKTTLTDSDSDYPTTRAVNTALGSKITWRGDNIASKGLIGATSNQAIGFITNNTEKMTILANGNVGIGTTAPGDKLAVTGSIRLTASSGTYLDRYAKFTQSGNDGGSLSLSFGGSGTYASYLDIQQSHPYYGFLIHKSSAWGGQGINGANNDLTISTGATTQDIVFNGNNFQSANEIMRLKGTGNVGIGTTSPTAKLDVASDILRLRTAKTPATAGATGNQGDIAWDSGYLYVCVATNTWKRAELLTW